LLCRALTAGRGGSAAEICALHAGGQVELCLQLPVTGAELAKLVAGKRASIELLDSADVPESGGALVVDAGSRAEVVAMVFEDPAVKAKMVEFEVLGE
jgi:hypothetical protein